MTESPYSTIDRCIETLNLDFSSEEFARLAAETAMTPESIAAVRKSSPASRSSCVPAGSRRSM